MLFLGKLLGAPIALPGAGMKWIFQTIADLADQELNDEGSLREQLILLQMQLEDGDIEEDEFAEREADLMARMREIRQRKQALAAQARAEEVPAEANVEARRRIVIETPFDQ
jgi:hypothetical protein